MPTTSIAFRSRAINNNYYSLSVACRPDHKQLRVVTCGSTVRQPRSVPSLHSFVDITVIVRSKGIGKFSEKRKRTIATFAQKWSETTAIAIIKLLSTTKFQPRRRTRNVEEGLIALSQNRIRLSLRRETTSQNVATPFQNEK